MEQLGRSLVRILHFQNHAPHSSRKHIFDFHHFSYRCKCPQFMFCCQHRSLSSCFDRHTGLSEFALSLVTCAQLSSWARTANTHGNIGCAFYASTAAQNTPEQVKEAQIQPRASQIQPRAAQIKPKPSQIKAKPAKIKSITCHINKYQTNSDRHHQLADLDEHTIFAGHFHTIANRHYFREVGTKSTLFS